MSRGSPGLTAIAKARERRLRFALMRTVIPDPPPPELEALLERRRRWGGDRHDEVWNGVLHMNPSPAGAHLHIEQQLGELLGPLARSAGLVPGIGSFNLGAPSDYRIPDGGLFREPTVGVWFSCAALALEIVSPGDETWDKLPFYAGHGVEELLIVDPQKRTVQWLALSDGAYREIDHSRLIELGPAELGERLDWPQLERG